MILTEVSKNFTVLINCYSNSLKNVCNSLKIDLTLIFFNGVFERNIDRTKMFTDQIFDASRTINQIIQYIKKDLAKFKTNSKHSNHI